MTFLQPRTHLTSLLTAEMLNARKYTTIRVAQKCRQQLVKCFPRAATRFRFQLIKPRTKRSMIAIQSDQRLEQISVLDVHGGKAVEHGSVTFVERGYASAQVSMKSLNLSLKSCSSVGIA